MIPGITEVNFPAYATLHEATITLAEMGENIITARIKIDGDIVPDFSDDWKVIYKGETFVLSSHTPQASKDTSSRCSFIDATFTSFPVAELRRYFFVELSEVETGTMIVDKYIATLRLNARDFIAAFNRVLAYYFGDMFSIVINADAELSGEVKEVPLEYTYLWDALTSSLYDIYGLTWKLTQSNGKYIIRVGDPLQTVSDHIFEYGFEGGLMRIERQLQDAEIYNQLLGRGGTKNLPYRYFKKTDPYNEIWAADPDACAELENVYFDRLMDINFRYYIKGWLRNPNRTPSADYPVPSTPEPAEIQQHWAYQKGLTDEKFQPVEYVEDAASVAEYGVRQGKLEDDDEIFPTIQGITVSPYGRIDEIVAVGAITDGDDSGVNQEISLGDITKAVSTDTGLPTATFDFYGPAFSVPAGLRGEIRYKPYMSDDTTGAVEPNFAYVATINTDYTKIVAERISDGEQFPISSIPGGDDYRLKITFVMNKFPTDQQTSRVVGLQDVRLFLTQTVDANDNPYCFRVWVKNIWQTSKGANESALEYMKRVWEPILGDRLGNEAKIVFSDGWMSVSSDYEFTIMDWPVFDQSKTLNGVQSEWMLTLAKSDAEVDSTGKYIPNATSAKPVAGDHFFFTGIDMPHIYVLWAEKKLNEKKQEALDTEAYANPTWAVQLDPVRIETLLGNENVTLMSQLSVGKVMKIYDPRFSGGQVLGLAIRSMTLTWHEGAVMRPSVDVVLSENVLSRTPYGGAISPSSINAQIDSAISRMGAASQKSFLSKEHDDVAVGKLRMAAGATFGAIGDYDEGAQQTAMEVPAASIDESGHAEFDSMRLRKWLEVPEMRYNRTEVQVGNQWRAPGGGIIGSVTPDIDGQGNVLNTGTINLKLEDGEIGKVAEEDICMGIFHDSINENSNAVADLDDSKGNFHFSGFYTTYFRITEVLGANNQCFRYVLRPTSTSWTETFHPCAQMHFVCYGNFDGVNHADRQSSRYSTRTYERYLKNVNTWEFQASNVAAQFGELSNLADLGLPGMSGYSTYIENIYMTGRIQQVGLPLHIELDWTGQNVLSDGDTINIGFNVLQGFDNLNSQVASWAIERDSGAPTADANWNRAYAGWTGNVAALSHSDLGSNGISTLFTVIATMSDNTTVQYGFTLMNADEGAASSVIFLDLDNQNDSMLYDAELNKLSGNVVSTATLYEGGEAVTSGVTYSHTASSGLTVSRSGNTITVSAMTVVSGQVVVSATYKGKTYTAQLNLTRLVGASKYELICTPDSIAYNTTIDAISSSTINVKIYKTAQVSNGAVGRTLLTSLPSGLLWLGVDGSGVTYSGSNGYEFDVDTTKSSHVVTLRAGSSSANIWDQETIPINKVANGAKGDPGAAGSDGSPGSDGRGVVGQEIRYQVGTSGTTAPTGVWQTTVPSTYVKGTYLWTRIRLLYTDGNYGDPSYSVAHYGEDGDPGSPGGQGPQGIAGCMVRVSTWETGKQYRNDEALTSGTRYVDVVILENVHIGATTTITPYKAKAAHNGVTSSSSNKPGTSGGNTYWEAMSYMTPMMTPLLIAQKIAAEAIDVGSITATNAFINAVRAQKVEADKILTTSSGNGYLQMQDDYLRMFDSTNQERLLISGNALSELSAQSTSDPSNPQSWSNATIGSAISYSASVDERTVTYSKTIVSSRSLSQSRILSLPRVGVTINVTRTSAVQGTQYFVPIVRWLVDGNEVAWYYGNNETLDSTSKSVTIYLPAASIAVASGSHSVTAQVSVYFTNLAQMQAGSITAKSSGSVSASSILWSSSVKKTEIASDGFRAALSADSYIMARLSGDSPIIELVNGSYGLRVSSSAVQIKRNGTWSDL